MEASACGVLGPALTRAVPALPLGLRRRGQASSLRQQPADGFDQAGEERLVDLAQALVLGLVAFLVALHEQAPGRCASFERVRQRLEDEVPLVGPVAVPAECGERRRAGPRRCGPAPRTRRAAVVRASRGRGRRAARAQARTSSLPMTNSLGWVAIRRAKESRSARLRVHSARFITVGFTGRARRFSAPWSAS